MTNHMVPDMRAAGNSPDVQQFSQAFDPSLAKQAVLCTECVSQGIYSAPDYILMRGGNSVCLTHAM